MNLLHTTWLEASTSNMASLARKLSTLCVISGADRHEEREKTWQKQRLTSAAKEVARKVAGAVQRFRLEVSKG